MLCPLCGQRRARRGCPALAKQICSVCCGTKRLVEIQCPSNCAYLTTAREHPAAVLVRQRQRDLGLVMQFMRDLNERQSQLFFLVATFLAGYQSPELQSVIDDDVAEAAAAVAGTFETASRGVIYEQRPASLPANRLATALTQLLTETGKNATSAFERDAAVVLRRIEQAARGLRSLGAPTRSALIELLGRVIRSQSRQTEGTSEAPPEPPRLIVP